jgi:hypothetical protein
MKQAECRMRKKEGFIQCESPPKNHTVSHSITPNQSESQSIGGRGAPIQNRKPETHRNMKRGKQRSAEHRSARICVELRSNAPRSVRRPAFCRDLQPIQPYSTGGRQNPVLQPTGDSLFFDFFQFFAIFCAPSLRLLPAWKNGRLRVGRRICGLFFENMGTEDPSCSADDYGDRQDAYPTVRPCSALTQPFVIREFAILSAKLHLLIGPHSLCFTLPERRVCGCSFRLRKDVNE